MRKSTTPHQNRDHIEWHAEKPFTVAPKVTATFNSEGTRMYQTTNGLYLADTYDKMFGTRRGMVDRKAKDPNPARKTMIQNANF